ncbi:MAG: hypothetical protein M1839_001270 [Geoglossum umbratile]|nr:MAG: hypothetical protein M1839_001270 [Geoglossum umbratile]
MLPQSGPPSQPYLRVKSAQEYAGLVAAHARQATGDSLYPGLNYENLSQYLLQPYLQPYQPRSSRDLSSEKSETACDACFAVLYNLSVDTPERITPFSSPEAFESSESIHDLGDSGSGYLMFLRGNPTPEWLNTIGYRCNVDPEFFLRHLDFRSTAGKPNYFNLPCLPSSNSNFMRLRWTTIGLRGAAFERNGHNQEEIESLRNESARAMERYLDDARSGHKMKICDSFVRRFAVHDETHFTFQQDVSICINSVGKSWIVIVWQDVGNDLVEGPSGPWLASPKRSYSWTTRALPTVQYKPNMALEAWISPASILSEGHQPRKFTQSASLLYLNYGKSLKQETLSCNAFYALTDLFKFTAFSEVQFLNMMETKLTEETDFSTINSRHSPTLSNILYSKKILDQHVQQIDETISSIKAHNRAGFRADQPELDMEASIAAARLLKDFEYLSERAKMLSVYCDRGMNIVMNNNMLAESQRAIQQAAGVAKLTKLAFFYIPLSFTTSFFGMNFTQFGTGELSIWIWFIVSAPVFLVSVLLLIYDISRITKTFSASIRRLFGRRRI